MMSFTIQVLILLVASQVYCNSIGVGDSPKVCQCVPWYQCDESGHIITDGAGLIDPRKANKPEAEARDPKNCKNNNEVCCLPPGEDKTLPPSPSRMPELSHQCGHQHVEVKPVDARIMNSGRTGASKIGEHPWQAAILRTKDNKKYFAGAGVLIDDLHILTAAHKIVGYPLEILTVRLGAWNLTMEDQPDKFQDLKVAAVIVHPKYNNVTLKNDLAVVTFTSKMQFGQNIGTICLPVQEEKHDGKQCITTGWGKDAFEAGRHSEVLKQVPVPVVAFSDCQNALRKTRLGQHFELDSSFMCAGGEQGFDACVGDGGGPLVCMRKDGTYGLMGLVSWGIDCGQPGIPGVYVSVTQFLDWITSVTNYPINRYWPSA